MASTPEPRSFLESLMPFILGGVILIRFIRKLIHEERHPKHTEPHETSADIEAARKWVQYKQKQYIQKPDTTPIAKPVLHKESSHTQSAKQSPAKAKQPSLKPNVTPASLFPQYTPLQQSYLGHEIFGLPVSLRKRSMGRRF